MKFYKLSHDLRIGKKYPQVDCLCPLTASQISPWNKLWQLYTILHKWVAYNCTCF